MLLFPHRNKFKIIIFSIGFFLRIPASAVIINTISQMPMQARRLAHCCGNKNQNFPNTFPTIREVQIMDKTI